MASVAIKFGKALPLPFTIGLGAGALAALVVSLLPGGLIDAIVASSGLPAILAAATPPLGATARILLAIVSGALAMTITCGGLVLADHIARRLPRRDRAEPIAEAFVAPRRRALAMPEEEESLRRPIFAESDLGRPFAGVTAHAVTEADPVNAVIEHDMVDDRIGNGEVDTEYVVPQYTVPEFKPLPEVDEDDGEEPELLDLAPIAAAMRAEPDFEDRAKPIDYRSADLYGEDAVFEAVEEYAIEDTPVEIGRVDDETADFEAVEDAAIEDIAEPQPAPAAPVRRAADYEALSIAELLARLEAGLERKSIARPAAVPTASSAEPHPVMTSVAAAPANIDDALRDALGTLQRMTARSR